MRREQDNREGIALIVALLFIALALAALGMLTTVLRAGTRQSKACADGVQCLYAAELAIAESVNDLESGGDGSVDAREGTSAARFRPVSGLRYGAAAQSMNLAAARSGEAPSAYVIVAWARLGNAARRFEAIYAANGSAAGGVVFERRAWRELNP